MRILLIDNHDSFTHNLLQLLRDVPGATTVVVRNDAPLPLGWTSRFDAVVISPGPGHPGVPADVGSSREVLEHSELPVLGVCLGHQLLALLHGCEVGPSDHPIHGESSVITHGGDPLFDGIPTEFSAVRYHSLAVRSVNDPIVPLAHAADGTLMALRVSARPRWGVQFHPESIESDFGATLIGNFLRLAAAADDLAGPPVPTRQRSVRLTRSLSVDEVLDRCEAEPTVVLDGIATADGSPCTVIGWDDPRRAHRLVGNCAEGAEVVSGSTATRLPTGILDTVQRRLAAARPVLQRLGDDPGMTLGYAGYVGYELGIELLGLAEPHLRAADDWPDAWWLLVSRAVVIDHENRCYVVGLDDPDDAASIRALDDWTAGLVGALEHGTAADSAAPDTRRGPMPAIEHGTGQDDYLALISDCRSAIARGESYELCLTHRIHGTFTGDPLPLFRALRAEGRVPRAAYLRLDQERTVVSGSPELFLRVDADGHAISAPIKGTRPATGDTERDAASATELATSRKDRAENLMIVDLVRNDFNRVAIPGSTKVTKLYGVRAFPTVIQLVSTIECDLPPGADAMDLVRVAFPPGSMTGAPKERSVEILGRLEPERRGVYSGSIGLLGIDGTATLSVAIRTVQLTGDRFVLGVGGAITQLSDPEAEWQETLDKAQSVLQAMAACTE
ncbi:MAG TPA: chorismate-binding protein [Flexivirga sp.]|uniref:chorismate-binding protein n=1 Tax=Flexivirga sp. TaxID=1962927 RepID=UPI002B7F45DF|nr:chorismate-binding protein [Flexivirga sp.]HWC22711.1 chorismate-binding protein [Flexivirga sp.]